MERTLSSWKFIIIILAIVVVLIALWFVVPTVKKQIDHVQYMASHYVTQTTLTDEQRSTIEQSIRDIESEIASGDTKDEPTMTMQYIDLGIHFASLGRNDLSLDAYKRAANADPTSFVAFSNIGSVHEAAGNYEDAKDAYRQAISKAPTESSNYQKLAELYWYHLDEVAVARGVFIEGLMGTNQDPNLMRAYALFLEQNNYLSESLLYWQEIAKQSPDDARIQEHINSLLPTPTP
ncbi:MAG: tetratricopeptide repeat protein [bacterium]|nr:tetratricopeptide repeat protein [bacterium]